MKTKDLDKKPSVRELEKNPSGRDLPSAMSHQSRLQQSKSPLVKPTGGKDTTRTIPEASAAAEVDKKKSGSLRRGSPGKSQEPGSAASGIQILKKNADSKRELETKGQREYSDQYKKERGLFKV